MLPQHFNILIIIIIDIIRFCIQKKQKKIHHNIILFLKFTCSYRLYYIFIFKLQSFRLKSNQIKKEEARIIEENIKKFYSIK